MNQYELCQNKAKKFALLLTSFLSIIFIVFLYVGIYSEKRSGLEVCSFLISMISGVGALSSLGLIAEAFNSKNYFPQYKVGDTVIISKIKENGSKEFPFSQYDEIIAQIPQYSVKHIGDCSYLLEPKNTTSGTPVEIAFTKHKNLYSIEDFKNNAKCC